MTIDVLAGETESETEREMTKDVLARETESETESVTEREREPENERDRCSRVRVEVMESFQAQGSILVFRRSLRSIVAIVPLPATCRMIAQNGPGHPSKAAALMKMSLMKMSSTFHHLWFRC